jgi:hypothetical protein
MRHDREGISVKLKEWRQREDGWMDDEEAEKQEIYKYNLNT